MIGRTSMLVLMGLAFIQCTQEPTDPPDSTPRVEHQPATMEQVFRDAHEHRPARRLLQIEHRPVRGMAQHSAWHLAGSNLWVRLHPTSLFTLDRLNADETYFIDGAVLDHAYGTVDIWVYKLNPVAEKVSAYESVRR
jgi:hypothetical protein